MGSAVFGQEVLSLFLFPFSSPLFDGAQQTPLDPSQSRVVPGWRCSVSLSAGGTPGVGIQVMWGQNGHPGTQWCFGIHGIGIQMIWGTMETEVPSGCLEPFSFPVGRIVSCRDGREVARIWGGADKKQGELELGSPFSRSGSRSGM